MCARGWHCGRRSAAACNNAHGMPVAPVTPSQASPEWAEYTASVTRLLVADYVEDLAAGVLGASQVCLFFVCLESSATWAA